jgi:signal transduction histidine kinase
MAAGIVCWASVIALQWGTQRRRALQQLLGYTPVLACFVIYLLSISGPAALADLRLLFLLGQIGTTLALGWWMAQEFERDRHRREDALALNVAELQANRRELERYQGDLETIVADRTTELQQALNSERAIVAQQRDFAAMIGHEFRHRRPGASDRPNADFGGYAHSPRTRDKGRRA